VEFENFVDVDVHAAIGFVHGDMSANGLMQFAAAAAAVFGGAKIGGLTDRELDDGQNSFGELDDP